MEISQIGRFQELGSRDGGMLIGQHHHCISLVSYEVFRVSWATAEPWAPYYESLSFHILYELLRLKNCLT